MNQPRQRLRPSPRPFWKRILERYKFRGRLLRARVPLVLFRFWSGASRQAHTGLRPSVAQYPFNLQLQFFLQQSISNESGPRAMIERSIFTHLGTKELKQVWEDPRRTESSATQRSYDAIRPSAKASANANIFATSAARIGELAHRRRSVSAVGASSSSLEGANALQPTLVPSGRVTRAFRSRGAVIDVISAPGQSQFSHPAQTEGSGQSLLKGSRSRLFEQSAWLNLASPRATGPAAQPAAQRQIPLPPPPVVVPASQPQFDIGRLSDEVYRHIQRKIRIERERRGI